MSETAKQPSASFADPSTKLSSRRTGMSFQRTRMSADRTLMSVIRTSMSLISFGFTIYKVFQKMSDQVKGGVAPGRNFGVALVLLGIVMLILGIIYHLQFMLGLRRTRQVLITEGLIYPEKFPVSLTLVTAALLLVIGVGSVISMIFRIGPFE